MSCPAFDQGSAPNDVHSQHLVSGHSIASSWDGILTDIEVYLKEASLVFTAVMPLGFANIGLKKPFCPLVVAIGVEPKTVVFEDAKAVAKSVKINILAKASFDNIDVAVWEFTSLSGSGPKLPSLDPKLDGPVTEFRHPFASTLGIAVAPFKQPGSEGSLGTFLTCGDGDELLGLTAAHVVRPPPPMFPDNYGLSVQATDRHHEEIIALGYKAYRLGIKRIQTKVGNLLQGIKLSRRRSGGPRDCRVGWTMAR